MEILNLFLPATNKFATEYSKGNPEIQQFFHYDFQKQSDYEKRISDLKNRTFLRNEIADHIKQFMERYPSSEAVLNSIEKLKDDNSVVVIGGQQAGILTGPLYSIHKVISIVLLAKEKEAELGVPVIPVFWIAGEDHDYHEVNHVFVERNATLEKWVYPEKVHDKRMVSDVTINQEVCFAWVQEVVETFGETEYTNELLQFAKTAVQKSETFVDFFAFIIMELFKEQGLLLVDSGNTNLRKLEKDIFTKQIIHSAELTRRVKETQAQLGSIGFSNTIDIGDEAANLFYYDRDQFERILLDYDSKEEQFSGKNGSVTFSKEELLEMALEFPEKLSNNVVTRPMTQEFLFPTLAFIAGPGEISYWAELQSAFEFLGLKMPPIVPRINITLLERNIEAEMQELQLNLQEVLTSGVTVEKENFLDSVKNKTLNQLFKQTKEQLLNHYLEIGEITKVEFKGLVPLLNKNQSVLLKQIEFMESKVEEATQLKHNVVVDKYNHIEASLRPSGSPQERMWNIFYYLNKYGLHFINNLLENPMTFDGSHKVVKL